MFLVCFYSLSYKTMYALTALAADNRVVTELMNKTRANSAMQSLYISKRVAGVFTYNARMFWLVMDCYQGSKQTLLVQQSESGFRCSLSWLASRGLFACCEIHEDRTEAPRQQQLSLDWLTLPLQKPALWVGEQRLRQTWVFYVVKFFQYGAWLSLN